MTTNQFQSYLAVPTSIQNFRPLVSALLAVGTTSTSITVGAASLVGSTCSTFKITNKGSNGAYLGWGNSNAGSTTVAITSSSTFVPFCDYIAKGAILTQDFQSVNGIVDTLAAIGDGGATTLEVTYGYGQ